MQRAILAIAAALLGALPAGAAELSLWRLDCGTIKVKDLSLFSDTFAYGGRSQTLTDSCYLIKHDQDLLLWDSGLPAGLLNAPDSGAAMSPSLSRTLPDQLAEIGVKPEQIGLLGISHYHFDHLGQAAAFPQARLLIAAADLAALKTSPPPFGADPSLVAPWLAGGAPVDPILGDRDLFGDGSVVILATPGHTPGSQALLVRLAGIGPVLLTGDVVHFEEQFANHGVPPFNTSRAESLASMDRLTGIAESLGAVLVVQHDAGDIAKLPAFPAAAN